MKPFLPSISRVLGTLLRLTIVLFFVLSALSLQPASPAAAVTGHALQFNGSTQYVTFGVGNSLATPVYTIETWFKRTGPGVGVTTGTGGIDSAIPLITKGTSESENAVLDINYFLGIDASTGVLIGDFEEGAAGAAPSQNHPVSGATVISNNTWYHAAMTYDGSTLKIYLNGTLEGSLTVGQPTASATNSPAAFATSIRSNGTSLQGFFAGVMDEVRIWSVAHTQAEIRATINSELTSGTGLIARWGMNEGSGTTIASSVGSYTGTLVNGPAWVTPDAPFNITFDTTPPAAPTGLVASPGNAAISLSWTANTEADMAGYNVYRSLTSPVPTTTHINTSLVTPTTYVDTGLTNGIPYYYVVKAVDRSGNESVGASNEAHATPAVGLASALQFDGSNDYVTFGTASGLNTQNFTVETWFKRTGAGSGISTGTNGVVLAPMVANGAPESDNSVVDENYILGIRTSDGVLAGDFETYAACDGRPAGDNTPIVGITPIVTGAWYHAALTYDGAALRLYLNGNLESSLATTCIPRYDNSQPAALGTMLTASGTPTGYFAGVLDEVRVWNVAHTQQQIRDTINDELTSDTGLIARWGLNEGTGTSIASSVGSFPGTLTNGPAWVSPGAPFNITFDTIPPAAPTLLTATGGNASVALDWSDNSEPDLAGYNLYRGTTPGAYTKVNASLIIPSSTNDTGLSNGTEYFYVVRAVDTSGNESGNSNEAYAIPMADEGSGLEFTAASGTYVTFGDPAKLDLATFTIETWFKRTGAGTSVTTGNLGIAHAIPLVSHGAQDVDQTDNRDANWMLVIDDDTDVIAADFEDMASGLNHPILGVTAILNNVWHHAAVTFDGTSWRLYLDGHLENTLDLGGAVPRSDTIEHAALGTMLNSTGGTNGFFQGVLDEARVWNRALSQSELLAHINQQLTSGSGLVARWGLNEGGGTTVGDSIPTVANGTITGSNYAWVPGAPFNLGLAPATPSLVAPADQATGVATSPTLTVHVSDPFSSDLSVSFYGRLKNGPPGEDFTLIAIPDPQYYAASYPAIYNAQMNWVVTNKTSLNIPFVMSLGDNVDNLATQIQWDRAKAAWDLLGVGGVPYGLELGNHDGAPGNTAAFNTAFGSQISSQATYGGRYGISDYDNTYSRFSADGMDFIVVFIEYDDSMTSASNAVLVWADGVLAANPERRAIVVTHNLLDNSGNFTSQGAAIYAALKGNPNLFLMLGGHLDGSVQRTDVYDGHTVYSLRSDYQFVDSQQSGYLRMLRFSPADNRIYVSTYSPTQMKNLTDSTNQFDLSYAMSSTAPFSLIGTTTAASGTDASVVWPGLLNDTEYEWYAVASNGAEAVNSSIWSFTTESPTNLPPEIAEGTSVDRTMSEDGTPDPFSLTLNATDPDVGDTLTWSISSPATNGTATASGTGASKSIGYTPHADYYGLDSFVVQVSDGNGGTDTITVNVTIQAVNDPPLITGQNLISTAEETARTIDFTDLLVTDVDNTYPTGFTLTVQAGSNYTLLGNALTPALDFNGTLTVPVVVNDGADDSNTFDLSVTVTAVNDPPVITGQNAITTAEETARTIELADLVVTDVDNTYPTGFSLTVQAGSNYSLVGNTLTPALNFNGTLTVPVVVNDGADDSNIFDLSVTVTPVNDAPELTPIADATLDELAPFTFTATATDVDAGSILTFSLAGVQVPTGAAIGASSGVFTWTPTEAQGPQDYTFTVQVCDNGTPAMCVGDEVTLTVNEVNQAPLAVNDAYSVKVNTPLNVPVRGVLANDTDADLPANPLTAVKIGGPDHGTLTLNADGSFTYMPDAGWSGVDHFTYQAFDGALHSATATVTITVSSHFFYLPSVHR